MAERNVYIARFGAWIARKLADVGGFAADPITDWLGLQVPRSVSGDPAVAGASAALADAAAALLSAADDIDAALAADDSGALSAGLLALAEGLRLYADATRTLCARMEDAASSLPAADRAVIDPFLATLPRKLIDSRLLQPLELEHPLLAFYLKLAGLIDWRFVEPSGTPYETPFVRRDLKLERLEHLIEDPLELFRGAHRWGEADFDPYDVMQSVLSFHRDDTGIDVDRSSGDAFLEIGPFRWARDSWQSPPGLLLDVAIDVDEVYSERLEDEGAAWAVEADASLELEGGAIFRLKPPLDLVVEPKTGAVAGAFAFTVNRAASARGFAIVDGVDLLRLTADDVAFGAALTIGARSTVPVALDPSLSMELRQLTLTLGSESSDSFLASLLGGAGIEGVFDIALRWSGSEGLVVAAAGGLEVVIPMHQSLGIATFETLFLIFKVENDGTFALETSAGISGKLGPLSARVERIGVEIRLGFSESAEAPFGPVELSIAFKPPHGVALSLDAGVVTGGGYLYLDFEKGQYAGVLELTFTGFMSFKAVGIVNTIMPDGSDGFSLVIVVTAEFATPLQLGLGFTLIGVGGLLGLNRTMALEELAEGVRTGAVESVMFPRDPVVEAPRIISDMARFFPPEEGPFLIGPMAKLGWGTPTLVSATLGVVIEDPPGNVAIVGVLKCALPDEDSALLVLQVKFIGALEVDKSRLWFFASMYGSRVLFITIDGELGLLVDWGERPGFVLSVGGFHPSYTPPPLPFPTPAAVSLSILDTSFARVRVEGYFAVTSNTAQFGARAELFFGLSEFSVEGHASFDALFKFSPFYFEISYSSSMSVKVFGAGLFSTRIRGSLKGTSPWHVEGEGSVSLLFFDLAVPFSHTWGESADTLVADIDAMPIIEAEVAKAENWIALPPASTTLSVALRTLQPTEHLVLHPVGVLRISQRAVPLELTIQRIGSQKIADIEKAALVVNGGDLVEKAKVEEDFATAQYQDMEAASKLSAPGYEPQTGGADISVADGDTRTTHAVKRIVLHELITVDNNYKEHIRRFFNVGVAWFTQLLASNATSRSVLSKANQSQRVPFDERIVTTAPGFAIANAADNTAWAGTSTFSSHARARDALAAQIAANPSMAADLHVLPASELREAA